jgi:hypothetical protein
MLYKRCARSDRWRVGQAFRIFFHALMNPAGLPLAIVVVVLWSILAVRFKQYLAGIFVTCIREATKPTSRSSTSPTDWQLRLAIMGGAYRTECWTAPQWAKELG